MGDADMVKKFTKQTFDTDLGQKATVVREEATDSEMIQSCHETLRAMGSELGKSDPSIKHLTYLGSAAVHIYASEVLVEKNGTPKLAFFHQTAPLGRTNELLAAAAGQDLLKAIARRFGRKPPAKRSGF